MRTQYNSNKNIEPTEIHIGKEFYENRNLFIAWLVGAAHEGPNGVAIDCYPIIEKIFYFESVYSAIQAAKKAWGKNYPIRFYTREDELEFYFDE